MTRTEKVEPGQLSELLERLEAGDEIVLLQANKPVAKLVSTANAFPAKRSILEISPFVGHRVITPLISRAEIADEMFGKK